jgi:DNA-binding MarR family transcriptional regulator
MSGKKYSQEIAGILQMLQKDCWRKDKILAKKMGITVPEFNLMTFFGNDHTIMIRDLINYLNLTPGRVTHLVSSLENQKLLKRHLDKNDRRVVIVKLTARGKVFAKKVQDELKSYFDALLGDINASQAQELIKNLNLLSDVFSRKLSNEG